METLELKLTKKEALEHYAAATPLEKKLLENHFGVETFSGNIMDRCKTFDDLCRECGFTEKVFNSKFCTLGLDQDTIGYEMAKIMTRAFNQGKVVDYSNPSQKKWWPVHDLSVGCRFVVSDYLCVSTTTLFGPRLAFLNKEHSDYCANQFPKIFKYFLT